jgi:hypothetical protein
MSKQDWFFRGTILHTPDNFSETEQTVHCTALAANRLLCRSAKLKNFVLYRSGQCNSLSLSRLGLQQSVRYSFLLFENTDRNPCRSWSRLTQQYRVWGVVIWYPVYPGKRLKWQVSWCVLSNVDWVEKNLFFACCFLKIGCTEAMKWLETCVTTVCTVTSSTYAAPV